MTGLNKDRSELNVLRNARYPAQNCPCRLGSPQVTSSPPPFAGQCASLEEQMRRLAEQYEQEQKAHNNLASILGEHIEHVGKLTANYKALTDDLTELFR